jgi:transcriptional regulator with XRE-family HTH domain
MKIGSAIERLRKARGLTQDDLADKAITTKSSLSKIEKDKQWPRPELLEAIASALDVQVYQIFALAEDVDTPLLPDSLAPDEWDFVKGLRAMEPDQRDAYIQLVRTMGKDKKN